MKPNKLFLLLIVTSLLTPRLQAEEPVSRENNFTELTGLPVTISEISEIAFERSLQAEILRMSLKIKETELQEALGRYDLRLKSLASYDWIEEQQPIVVMGEKTITGLWNFSAAKKTSLGTELELYHENQRNSTSSSFTSLQPNYESHMGLRLRQPILNNGFGYGDRGDIRLIRMSIERMSLETASRVEDLVAQARELYWDLLRASLLFQADTEGRAIARKFLTITRDQIDTGIAEDGDLYAAEANFKTKSQDALRTRLSFVLLNNELKLLLSQRTDFLPSDKAVLQAESGNLDALKTEAKSLRRDLKRKQNEFEAARIAVKAAQVNLLPHLDLVGTVGSNALDRDQENPQGELFGFNHMTYFGGAEFSLPVENREARALLKRSRASRDKITLEIRHLEDVIDLHIESVYAELLTLAVIAEESAAIEELQRKKLAFEQEQFKNGRSSSKTVIDYQDDFIQSQKRRVSAFIEYLKAKDRLKLAQNSLLQSLNLEKKEISA